MKNKLKFLDGESYVDEVAEYDSIREDIPKYLGISEDEWIEFKHGDSVDKTNVYGLYCSTGFASINQQSADGPGHFLANKTRYLLKSIENMEDAMKQMRKQTISLAQTVDRVTRNRRNRECINKMEILNRIKKENK
tara:strand:- start:30 stop:437 length:408 start_codon:yes stop_codon:yes gene_type:complete